MEDVGGVADIDDVDVVAGVNYCMLEGYSAAAMVLVVVASKH